MKIIMPFRNALGPENTEPCYLCDNPIVPGKGCPLVHDDHVDGWVCIDCFAAMQYFAASIERHFIN